MDLLLFGSTTPWVAPFHTGMLVVTLIVLILVALVAGVMALWLAFPDIRRRLDIHLLSPEQALRDEGLARLDLDLQRYLKGKARQPQVIDLIFARKGRRHVSL